VDIRKVKKLMEMLEESTLSEMEIIEGEESIRLSKSSNVAAQDTVTLPTNISAPIINENTSLEKINNTPQETNHNISGHEIK